jgi:ribose/xylose/arabinose/galactoside ABC-type transport system permease subunit
MSEAATLDRAERRRRMLDVAQSRGAVLVLTLAVLAAGLVFPDFLRRANLLDIVTAASFVGLVTIGQSFVIIIGGFDLAVGSVVGLGTVIAATCAPYGWVPALAAPVLVGTLVGLVDGTLIARARMAPFIVTLAALLAIRALAVATAGESLVIADPGFFATIANGNLLGVGSLVWVLLAAYAAAALLLNRTAFGTAVFAVGGNEEAARMMGVRVERVVILAYCLSGALAGLTGALLAAHLDSGLSAAGTGYELQSIAAAVIGGVLLTGGVGTMAGALSGALLLGLIDNVINQIGTLSAYYQGLVSGAFLLLAVVVQAALSRGRGE